MKETPYSVLPPKPQKSFISTSANEGQEPEMNSFDSQQLSKGEKLDDRIKGIVFEIMHILSDDNNIENIDY